ncbi:MAG: isochorismate synthase, partial [Myxococcota bacterium]
MAAQNRTEASLWERLSHSVEQGEPFFSEEIFCGVFSAQAFREDAEGTHLETILRRLLIEPSGFSQLRAGDSAWTMRLRFELSEVDPLDWLRRQVQKPQVCGFWSNCARTEQWAGWGAVEQWRADSKEQVNEVFTSLQERLRGAPDALKYMGGMRFSLERPVERNWADFGHTYWFLPKFLLHRTLGECSLTLHVRLAPGMSLQKALLQVQSELSALEWSDVPLEAYECVLSERQDAPVQQGWNTAMAAVKSLFDQSQLKKIVLARQSTFQRMDDARELHAALEWLAQLRAHKQDTYLFLLQPSDHTCFVGATPERLCYREGANLYTEALAGTRPRGQTSEQDARYAHDLLHSEKERFEQRLVEEELLRQLHKLCIDVQAPEQPSVRVLSHVQHLCSPLSGRLKQGVGDFDVVQAFHPTPAVGGLPKTKALALLEDL